MSFGTVVVAVFCPPAYFLIRKRWVAFVIHCVVYLLAVALLISLVGAIFGILLWFFGFAHAMWDLRVRVTDEIISKQAQAIAEKMKAQAS